LRNCWTFGTAFNREQLIAQLMAPAYGPKQDILSSDSTANRLSQISQWIEQSLKQWCNVPNS